MLAKTALVQVSTKLVLKDILFGGAVFFTLFWGIHKLLFLCLKCLFSLRTYVSRTSQIRCIPGLFRIKGNMDSSSFHLSVRSLAGNCLIWQSSRMARVFCGTSSEMAFDSKSKPLETAVFSPSTDRANHLAGAARLCAEQVFREFVEPKKLWQSLKHLLSCNHGQSFEAIAFSHRFPPFNL